MEKHIQIIRTGIYKRPTLQITTLQQSGNLEIWQSRDNYKYDHKLLPQQTIIKKINPHLNSILLVHYKKHKLQDTVDTFRGQFCINEAIEKIQNNTLTTLL